MRTQNLRHFRALFESFKTLHADLVRISKEVPENLKNANLDEMADLVYVMKECEALADSLRKSYKNVKGRSEKTLCYMYVKQELMEPIRTAYCTVSPDMKVVTHIPSAKSAPQELDQLLKELGVPEEVRKFGCLYPRWGGMVEYCTHLAQEGLPLPTAAEKKVYNEFRTRVHKKKSLLPEDDDVDDDVDDDEENEENEAGRVPPSVASEEFMPPRYRFCCALCGSDSHSTDKHDEAVSQDTSPPDDNPF